MWFYAREVGRMRAWTSARWLAMPLALAAFLLGASILVVLEPWSSRGGLDVSPRETWTSYSWDELSSISDVLAGCADEHEAYVLASRYGLCGADGTLDEGLRKEVALLDGTSAWVTLVGVAHDERPDGRHAGLTFALCGLSREHAMNLSFEDAEGDYADAVGGWAASEARAWLVDTLWYELPADLRTEVVAVQKETAGSVDATDELASTGQLSGSAADWVTQTTDRLWLFSVAELCGSVPARDDLGVDETMCGIYGAEGSQYQLFAQVGAAAFAPCETLAHLGQAADDPKARRTWWLRTKTLEFGDGFWLVGTDGTPLNGLGEDSRAADDPEYAPDELWGPDHARALVVGFCL